MASLGHPNLALIFGAETWKGTPMLILEFLEGGTLASRLRHGPMPPSEVIALGIQMARVLEKTHGEGVLHRDIKPSNIGFTAEGTAKLMDFGLVHVLHDFRAATSEPIGENWQTMSITIPAGTRDTTEQEFLVGTPPYLAPETLHTRVPSISMDLWALAIVLYEAICGRNPMLRATLADTLETVSRGAVPDIRQYAPACPENLANFLKQALSLDQWRRPQNAVDFRTGLERLGL